MVSCGISSIEADSVEGDYYIKHKKQYISSLVLQWVMLPPWEGWAFMQHKETGAPLKSTSGRMKWSYQESLELWKTSLNTEVLRGFLK